MPDNPLMRVAGVADSHDDGLAYLQAVVGDVGPASTPERREMFLRAGSEMITFLLRKGVNLDAARAGPITTRVVRRGNEAGRGIEGVPFDAGGARPVAEEDARESAQAPALSCGPTSCGRFNISTGRPGTSSRQPGCSRGSRAAQLRRKDLLTNGASLIAQLVKVLMDLQGEPPIWTESPIEDLVVEDGRVAGVRVLSNGKRLQVEGRRGVLLAAGGFARNAEMRRRYSHNQPNEAQWTLANPGDTGEVLEAAMRLKPKTDLLDEAWWLPSTSQALGAAAASVGQARQRPGAIFVDTAGQRFCNESNSYVEVGKAMYANKAVPCWLIFDEGYVQRYAATSNPLKRRIPQEVIDGGAIKRGATVEDLGRQIGVDPEGLVRTVGRFNEYARKGLDPDFGRGQSAYNDCLGDPGHQPNHAVGPLDRAPYYATEVYPNDVGTCGGLITDQFARVLGENDQPIPGLYAAGNITATVMGRTYPGAGASIANTMVFGYVAARHAAGARLPGEPGIGTG